MFDKELMNFPGIKKLITKLGLLAFIQSLAIVFEALFLSRAIVNAWMLKKVTASFDPMLFFFLTFMLRYLITRIEQQICDRWANQTSADLKQRLLKHMYKLGPTLVSQFGSGNLVTLALDGMDKIKNYFNLIILKMINLTIIPIVLLIAVFFKDHLSGIVLLLVFPIIIYFMIILGVAAKNKSDQQYDTYTKMSNNFIETIRGLKTLKLFGLSHQYRKNIYNVSENYRKSTMSILKIALLSMFALDFLTTISIAIVAVFLGVRLINGSITLYPALAVLIISPDYFLPLRDFGNDYHATLNGKNALKQLIKVIRVPIVKAKVALKPFQSWQPGSTFQINHLNYRYPHDENNSLSDISFQCHGNMKIGIVGPSGAGKSTLLNAIGGWLTPSNASNYPFQINHQKIDSLAQSNWQQHISYIPQNPYIFAGTIKANIEFYRHDHNRYRVSKAAEAAGLASFLKSLRYGIDTRIGKGGRNISGGQAQRIALARILFDQNRSVLLFDEPTAHLDIETEYELKKTMLPILNHHLVFFATHRLHWMNNMDYLLVVQNGRIVEQGKPEALMEKHGACYQLVMQIRGEE
ncbi:thiol reductant ABC exporter subunit CydD [Philodulcilactobacillus myokoensis]|uniref:Thiol reductant ABC exporter subunit CydD n=1 Tax=Philodulcilactobacillus myokoensis TaxID=2929573 RepID=A0A9W6B0T4_9LACO|nr:thiol reductant ABC exporter subunit CydD [Philodulcilactobacillus myokoensis]GLB46064.1 thiol reductant ABC exporter subunit CydD [Philodulcilactobacillus myokoensis]